MKCPNCGADNAPEHGTCNYCGTHISISPRAGRSAVFARVKSSTEYANRNSPQRHARLPSYNSFHKAIPVIFFAVFIGGSGMMVVIALGMAGVFGLFGFRAGGGFGVAFSLAPLFMAIVPAGFVALGIFMFRSMRKKMAAIEDAPVEPIPVIVVDKRTQVSGGSGDRSASTHYFVTCEAEDGERKEFQVWDGQMYGRMSGDDAGILFVRAGYGLDFDRLGA